MAKTRTKAIQSYIDVPENTNPSFKYYGYYHADGFLGQESYMGQIGALGNSNVAMVNSAWDPKTAKQRVKEAKDNGMLAIVSIHGLFAGKYKGKNSGLHYNEDGTERYEVVPAPLRRNWKEKFAKWKNELQEYIDDGTIMMFYMDEPYWHGVCEKDFRKVTKHMREECPTVGFLHTMSMADTGAWVPDMLDGKPYVPLNPSFNEYVTDVMYDCYGYWNDEERKEWLEKLKATATNNQRIWGCAMGFINHTANDPLSTEILKASLHGMYKEGLNEPRYAGIINFTFAGGDPRAEEFSFAIGTNQYLNKNSEYFTEDLRQLSCVIGNKIQRKPLKEVKDLISSFDDTFELEKVTACSAELSIDRYNKRTGFASLKVTPSQEGLAAIKFNHAKNEAWDLTEAHHISLWAKSEKEIGCYALIVKDANGKEVIKNLTMGKEWTKFSIDVKEMIEKGLDLENLSISFACTKCCCTERASFNLDDLAIFYVEDETFPKE